MKIYDKYKDSGVEWIGEIPEGWEVNQLGIIGNFSSSGIDKKLLDNEPFVKIINYTDIYGNHQMSLDSKKEYMIVTTPQSKINEHLVKKGDLIFTPSSETQEDIGLSAVVIEDLNNTAFSYHVLRYQFHKNIDINFKKYLCNNYFVLNHFSKCSQGTTRQTLGRNDFKTTVVVIPSSSEQTAIANYLDRKTAEIDELIADKKRLLELYEEEKTAIINQAVTKGINPSVKMKDSGIEWLKEIPLHWEVNRIKYVATINPVKNTIYKDKNDEVIFLPMERVREDGSYNCELRKPIDELWSGFTYFEEGDIIVAKITPCFENGKGAYLEKLETKIGFGSTEFHVLRAKHISPEFLYYITRSKLFMDFGEAFMTGAAGQKRVPTNFLSEFQFCYPSTFEEQQSIVHHIETECVRIEAKKARTQKLIDLLTEYRIALISEVVTGKVKVTNSNE